MAICKIKGCGRKSRTLGLCNRHATRLKQTGTTDPGPKAHGPLEWRFWRKVDKREPDECWEWQGQIMPNGYGRISRGGKSNGNISAHRASVEIATGKPVPPDMVVMHSCDNPSCVNPNHLSVGTYQENTQDMIDKGRFKFVAPLGTENGKSVLDPEKVRYIRSQTNKTHAALSRELDVSVSCIRSVREGRTWSHVK